jgi:hypothetical protein
MGCCLSWILDFVLLSLWYAGGSARAVASMYACTLCMIYGLSLSCMGLVLFVCAYSCRCLCARKLDPS